MKSIDKLREWAARELASWKMARERYDKIAEIADEIERDVAELTDERDILKRQWEAGVDFDQRLEACADKREDVTLFGVDYTPLPLDADGVPIHVGDVLEWSDGEPFRVEGIGGETLFYIGNNTECEWTSIDLKHHHHAPTVEDLLREYALKCEEAGNSDPEVKRLATEYAARLMLAGDE